MLPLFDKWLALASTRSPSVPEFRDRARLSISAEI